MVLEKDLIMMISKSGETEELIEIIPFFKDHHNKIILLTGKPCSTLAKEADFVLDIGVSKEAEPLGLVPTVSTTAALAMGNAIVTMVLRRKNVKVEDFAIRHPGGSIGKILLLKVKDIMHSGEENPFISYKITLKDAIMEMTSKGLGCVSIIDENKKLVGIITDGDLRRILQKNKNPLSIKVNTLMTKDPVHISPETSGIDALELMEKYAITMIPVVDKDKSPIALLHMHDLIKAGLVTK